MHLTHCPTLALFFAFPLGIISPQISLLTKKCIFELLVSSPGQGNSETRRLLTLRRSFYRFRISYDERTIPPTTLRRRNQEQPNPTINNLGYMNNSYSLKPQEHCVATTPFLSDPHLTRAQLPRRATNTHSNYCSAAGLGEQVGTTLKRLICFDILSEGLIRFNSSFLTWSPHSNRSLCTIIIAQTIWRKQ